MFWFICILSAYISEFGKICILPKIVPIFYSQYLLEDNDGTNNIMGLTFMLV